MTTPCRLYLITPPYIEPVSFAEQFKRACDGGDIGALQLRLKMPDGDAPADDSTILKAAEILLPLCHEREIAFILNDKAELVKKSGADGVHIGQDDNTAKNQTISKLRKTLGNDAVIGVSCYYSGDYAMVAGEQGADYVSFGAFYPTTTKVVKAQAEPDILKWWSTYTELPCCAIGGITPENCTPLIKAGADFLAVISSVWNHPQSPEKAVAAFNAAIAESLTQVEN